MIEVKQEIKIVFADAAVQALAPLCRMGLPLEDVMTALAPILIERFCPARSDIESVDGMSWVIVGRKTHYMAMVRVAPYEYLVERLLLSV